VAGLLNLFVLPSMLLTLDKWSTTRAFEKPMVEIYDDDDIGARQFETENTEQKDNKNY
jgi:hypothetical protein